MKKIPLFIGLINILALSASGQLHQRRALIIVRSDGSAGEIVVTASPENIDPATVIIVSR